MLIPQACDIGLSYEPGTFFSKEEDRFTRYVLPPGTEISMSHAWLVLGEEILEAVQPVVKISPLSKYTSGGHLYRICRPAGLTDYQRGLTVGHAITKYKGVPYDGAKLALEAIDGVFHTEWWAKEFGLTFAPICSVVVSGSLAWQYGAKFFFKDPKGEDTPINAVVPNGILGDELRRPDVFPLVATNVQGG